MSRHPEISDPPPPLLLLLLHGCSGVPCTHLAVILVAGIMLDTVTTLQDIVHRRLHHSPSMYVRTCVRARAWVRASPRWRAQKTAAEAAAAMVLLATRHCNKHNIPINQGTLRQHNIPINQTNTVPDTRLRNQRAAAHLHMCVIAFGRSTLGPCAIEREQQMQDVMRRLVVVSVPFKQS